MVRGGVQALLAFLEFAFTGCARAAAGPCASDGTTASAPMNARDRNCIFPSMYTYRVYVNGRGGAGGDSQFSSADVGLEACATIVSNAGRVGCRELRRDRAGSRAFSCGLESADGRNR